MVKSLSILDKMLSRLRGLVAVFGDCLGTPLARRIVYGLFLVQAIYLVFMIPIGVPPDELAHIRTVEQYTQQSNWLPVVSEQTNFSLGDVTRSTDYFYHYLLSLVARVLPFDGLPLYVVFRLLSVLIAFLTLVVSARIVRRLGASQAVTTVGLLIVSNFAQILFMSAAINQDQVVWLATALGVLLLLRLWHKLTLVDGLILANVVLFAAISKKTFLPIAVLIGVVLLAILVKRRSNVVNVISTGWSQQRPAVVALAVVALIGLGLNIERFGGNIVKYQQISVGCDKIHSHQQCLNHGVYRRNAKLADEKPKQFQPISVTDYAPYWYYTNYRGIFGTQGWNGRALPAEWAYRLELTIISLATILAAGYSLKHWRRPESLVIAGSIGYIFIQFIFNYGVYLNSAHQGLALQGRYIFPIIVPFILLLTLITYRALKRWPLALAGLTAVTIALVLSQSGSSVIIRSNLYTDQPLRPVILFDPDHAISQFEPGV